MVKISASKGKHFKNIRDTWPHASEIGNARFNEENQTSHRSGRRSLPTPASTFIVFAGKKKTAPDFLPTVYKDTIISKTGLKIRPRGVFPLMCTRTPIAISLSTFAHPTFSDL